MIDPEFKAKWLEALRSGTYSKGKHRLYNEDSNTYCCLGVAAAVASIPLERIPYEGANFAYGNGGGNSFGLTDDQITEAYRHNDDHRHFGLDADFTRMADWIEETF